METVALKAAIPAARNCFALAMGKINKMLSYILHYKDNMDDIRSQRNVLKMLKKEIEQRVLDGERKLETIVPLVDDCLKDAEEFLADDKWSDFTDENMIREKDRSCFSLVQMNLKYRYLISRRAVKKSEITKEKITKMKDCSSRAVTLPNEPPKLGSMPTVYSKSLASRESTLKDIMEALKDKEVRVIGIYGMGGIGKTTLIEEVATRAAADGSLFSEVVMVEVSQAPDVSKMQQHIAERIGLPLQDSKSVDERALQIHERLKKKIPNEAGDRMLNKGGKQVVVILDNIWEKLDLDRVGIPHDCKIVLTTRSEDVCHKMGANKIFKVQGLDDTEATKLFLERAGRIADHDDGYNSVTSKLVKKCEGLPLAIVALADTLRDRDLSIWKDVAAKLGRPVSARVGGAIEEKVYPVLEWSYNFLSSDEKKKFFLLCCLFPLGSSITVRDLMRYGAGLGLFQHMNSLDEATEQANSWAYELKSSSLVLEAEDERHVKLQDVVRSTSMSIASKGFGFFLSYTLNDYTEALTLFSDSQVISKSPAKRDNVFQFGSFPRLLEKDTFKSYTAISMTKGHNHEPLSRFEFPRLEVLLLKGSRPSDKFSNNFFQGMKCLKVLVMSDMKFQTLPFLITQLKNLRTLHLERCDLRDISAISKLVDLLFLSLRESTIAELPKNFENLVHLKLLDLTGCSKLQKIHADVIARFTELEELYMMGCFTNKGWDNEEKVANLIELNSLSYLAVLELHVPSIDLLPDYFLFPHLSRFQISIGSLALNKFFPSSDNDYFSVQRWMLSSQILLLGNIEGSMLRKKKSINCLLHQTECLLLVEIIGLASVTDCLVNDGFRNLKYLYVANCHDMKYIASTNESNEEGVFPKLEELVVKRMCELKWIYHGPDLYDDFSHLKKLDLRHIGSIRSFWDDDDMQDNPPFFNKKMKFPSLEKLYIEKVGGIVKLWHLADVEEEVPAFPRLVELELYDLPELRSIWRSNDVIIHRSFQSLKIVDVQSCPSLEMLCPLSVAIALEQLEKLFVHNNKKMIEIIAKETGETNNGDTEMIIFPKLQDMNLIELISLKCFFEGSIKLAFSSLKRIYCDSLTKMVAFVIPEYPENSNALFNDKVVMPAIKTINIFNVHRLQEIWGSHLDVRSFNELETIRIAYAEEAINVFSLDAVKQMQNLKELNIQNFQLAEEFVDHVGFYNEEVENLALLPQLKNLVMDSFPQLKRIPWEELALKNLRELKLFKIHGLTSLFPVSVCRELVNLETLHIIDCEKMEEIVGGNSWDTNIVEVKVEFRCLNFLKLDNLPAFRSLGSNNVTLEFLSIEGVGFGQFQNQILLDLLQKFQHVKKLELGGCEELFNLEGRAYAIPPRLRKFKLYDMPDLERIPWMVFPVKSINYLKISEIHGLKFLFPASMYSEGFEQLEEIHIDNCKDLEQVFAQENSEDTSNNTTSTTIVLPRIKIITLYKLQNLYSFSSDNYQALEFPSLEKVEIRNCPVMETFTYGFLNTPRLCKIEIKWKNEECSDHKAVVKIRKEEAEETEFTEGETSREGVKGKSVEGETSQEGTKKEFVEGETSLRSFTSENYQALKFPSLEEAKIWDCPAMETFSYGFFITPRRYKINTDGENEKECFDLNAVIRKRKETKETESIEGETSREEGETSRKGAKGKSVEGETSRESVKREFVKGETSRGAKGESVEEDTNEEDAKGETIGEGAKEESVEGETSGEVTDV